MYTYTNATSHRVRLMVIHLSVFPQRTTYTAYVYMRPGAYASVFVCVCISHAVRTTRGGVPLRISLRRLRALTMAGSSESNTKILKVNTILYRADRRGRHHRRRPLDLQPG